MALVSIPQAVSTVATFVSKSLDSIIYILSFNTASGKHCCNFITLIQSKERCLCRFNTASGKHCCNLGYRLQHQDCLLSTCFNTASGKHCCNRLRSKMQFKMQLVSIPQAVSTVATAGSRKPVFMRFQKVVLENLKP